MKKLLFLIAAIAFYSAGRAQFTYTYTGKPRFQIVATQNSATLGVIQIELYPRIAPLHVRNFDSLVSKQFYDSLAFHRVVPGFVIQGGDPNTKNGPVSTWGQGQPGQPTVKAEFSAARHDRGVLSAARLSGNINSATSQFFICVANAPSLNYNYSIYGRVTSGMSVADAIVATPTVAGTQRPVNKISMFVTYIGSNDTVPAVPQPTVPRQDSLNEGATSMALKWTKVQDAVFYHVEVSRDSLFTDTVKFTDVTATVLGLTGLDPDTAFYWRVSANNGGHISTSPVRRFYTGAPYVDYTALAAKGQIERISVFPNPSTGAFNFTNTRTGETIEIYDTQGRLLRSVSAYEKTTRVDLTGLPHGNYHYKIRSSKQTVASGQLVVN